MARHRDIRNMDISDEYDGYDDVYGHSVDDDYYISPSNSQYMYHRDNSRDSRNGEFIQTEGNIQEEDEVEHELSDTEKAQLESCMEQIKLTLGPVNMPRNELVHLILKYKFNTELVVNALLEDPNFIGKSTEKKEKDVTNKSPVKFIIPPLSLKKDTNNTVLKSNNSNNFNIPKLSFSKPESSSSKFISASPKPFFIPKLNITINSNVTPSDSKSHIPIEDTEFNTLSELVSNHLGKKPLQEIATLEKKNATETSLHKDFQKLNIAVPAANNVFRKAQSLTASNMNNTENVLHLIDLSKALRNTTSLPNMTKSKSSITKLSEKFEIPFIDCENILGQNNLLQSQSNILVCQFDISHILQAQLNFKKKKSDFGKIICKKYKFCVPKIERSKPFSLRHINIFDFKVPSPDDQIQTHILQK